MKTTYLFMALLLLASASALAQTDEEEMAARVKAKVGEMGLKFTTTESGNYKFTMGTDQERTQLVFVGKNPSTYLNAGYMRVYTPVMKFASPEQIPKKTVIDLMNKNGNYKLGWFELVTSDDGTSVVYFSHKIPLSATAVNLYALLTEAAKIADKVEQTYTEKDEY